MSALGDNVLTTIANFGIWFVVFLFSLTFHEYGHALVAYMGGDRTAYHGGQVSLDPIPHVRREPFGMVLMPLISFFLAGWMMGWASAPYDPRWARAHPRRQALMSLAGPGANFVLAVLALGLLRLALALEWFVPPPSAGFARLVSTAQDSPSLLQPLGMALSIMLNLNVMLGLFNLLPLPPLDGAGVVEGLAPGPARRLYEKLSQNTALQFLGLLVAWKLFSLIQGPAFAAVLALVHPDVGYS
ncbi:MAG: site-2 protease family protein [Proteobacteria bacterium]|nr:site-2 protease family protein [Pseudomonadota bacterium]